MKRKKFGLTVLLLAAVFAVFGLVGPDETFPVTEQTGPGITDFKIWDCLKGEAMSPRAPATVDAACDDEWSSRQAVRTAWFAGAGVFAVVGALCLKPRREKPQRVLFGGEPT